MAHNGKWAVSVIICGPQDMVPLVLDPDKPTPHYWKLPGGRSEDGETPEGTALREVEEEVGLHLNEVAQLSEIDRGNHKMYFFGGKVETFAELKEYGDEGERVHLFSTEEMEGMMDLFPPHRKLLESLGVFSK